MPPAAPPAAAAAAAAQAPPAGDDTQAGWPDELRALSARLASERTVAEVAAALRPGLDEAGSEFSYARARGLRALSAAVRLRERAEASV
jgi:hypothetical protein